MTGPRWLWMFVLTLGMAIPNPLHAGDAPAVQNQSPLPTPPPLPPLEVDPDAPLLLDEPAQTNAVPARPGAKPQADNARCFVCHVNFKPEPLVLWHTQRNIGCVQCHGESKEHIADENNLTPPDVMYAPHQVGFSCAPCHPHHNAPARDLIARWQECCPQKTTPADLLCTDCHGNHRLSLRIIRWDRATRKLISKTGTFKRPTSPEALPPLGPPADAKP